MFRTWSAHLFWFIALVTTLFGHEKDLNTCHRDKMKCAVAYGRSIKSLCKQHNRSGTTKEKQISLPTYLYCRDSFRDKYGSLCICSVMHLNCWVITMHLCLMLFNCYLLAKMNSIVAPPLGPDVELWAVYWNYFYVMICLSGRVFLWGLVALLCCHIDTFLFYLALHNELQ